MKPATITEIKKELKFRSQEQLIEYCLTMARFKLESKELLTYLVFESENEQAYIDSVKFATFSSIIAVKDCFVESYSRKAAENLALPS